MAQKDTMADALMLVGGGIVGAGLALLLAPKAGKETRKDIVRMARTVGSKTDKVVHEFADNVAELADTIGEKASNILNAGSDLAPESKKELLAAIERGQVKLEKQRQRLARLIG
jgi:gas vesicle protein